MIGVDYDLFWTLNPKSLSPFIKAFDLKQKYDDTVAWQQGYYIRMAIASCFDKNAKYPSKPLGNKEKDSEMDNEEIKRRFLAHANMINRQFGKEEIL